MPPTGLQSMPSRLCLFALCVALASCQPAEEDSAAETTSTAGNSVQPGTGELIADTGWELVNAHCSGCHSLSLVTQNRMSRSNWISIIRWMQKKQGLWELGNNEAIIVDYLEKNYGVADVPWRRKPLDLGSE